uniref:Uncharacterized protein n=1 Tax=Arundo donax TaxID=35708 RepID=A0A0A9BI73_ARUDO
MLEGSCPSSPWRRGHGFRGTTLRMPGSAANMGPRR